MVFLTRRRVLQLWLLLQCCWTPTIAVVTVSNTNGVLDLPLDVTCMTDSSDMSLAYEFTQEGQNIQGPSSSPVYTFSLLGVSDAGPQYQCIVYQSDMELERATFALNITIPGFTWRVLRAPSSTHYLGQHLTIRCLGFLADLSGLQANASILDPHNNPIPAGVAGDRVRFYDIAVSGSEYETRLEFTSLSTEDVGDYQCTGTVMPIIPNTYINNGVGHESFPIQLTRINVNLDVTATTPLTRLLDSAPYNRLVLSCNVETKVRLRRVDFNMTFSWWQSINGGQRNQIPPEDVSVVRDYGSEVTSMASVNVSMVGGHTYFCRVSLDLRPAPEGDKTMEAERNVVVYGPAPPSPPVYLATPLVLHDRVTVTWNVSLLTYDPETYVVKYGTSMVSLNQESGRVNFTSVVVVGLEVSTRYYYQVEATNSNGSSTSDFSSFTTTTSPPQPPRSLVAMQDQMDLTQYNFQWVLDEDPEGVVTRQKITCMSGSSDTPLSVEVGRSAKSASLRGFMYLETYLCEIRAEANNVYSQAGSNATFTVAEGVPDVVRCGSASSPVGRFSEVRGVMEEGVVNVSVSWQPPENPRGLIVNYTLVMMSYTSGVELALAVVPPTTTSHTFTQLTLEAGVPYNVSLVAANSGLVKSPPCFITDFSKQLAPPPVMDLKVERTSGSEIQVTWTVPDLVQARGFVEYTLEYSPTTPTKQRRQADHTCSMSPCTVLVTRGGVLLTDLDPKETYLVRVRPMNEDGDMGTLMSGTANPVGSGGDLPLLPIIIGGVVGVVLVGVVCLCCCIIICCVLSHRSKGRASLVVAATNSLELDKKEDKDIVLSMEEAPFYSQPSQNTLADRVKPIAVMDFSNHVARLHANRDKLFDAEFDSLGNECTSASEIAKVFKSKNRFQNIHPYDFSRVKIEALDGVEGSDYINASFIDGYGKPNAYIAAQGPMPTTVGDFWRMIWEQQICTVVMLTKFVEGGKRKCEPYWPDNVGGSSVPQGTSLEVTFKEMIPFADFMIRRFEVRRLSEDEDCDVPHQVTHFQFLGWPDHGVPKFATSLIQFIRCVKRECQHQVENSAPLLVHCSAGVGRTGTFITLNAMLDRMREESSVCVFDFVRNMRAKRVFMVQLATQYIFIHDALEELITCGNTAIEAAHLRETINQLNLVNTDTMNTGFEDQFELLKKVGRGVSKADRSDALQHYNERKNRFQDIVPSNNNRVKLRSSGDQGSDYINASYVDGYKHRNAYIATQAPLENTIQDFWRMVWELNSHVVVLLGPMQEEIQTLPVFWPEQESVEVEYGRLMVTLISQRQVKGCIERKIHIRGEKVLGAPDHSVTVVFYHYDNWGECGRPLSPSAILFLVANLGNIQRTTGNKPITVVCSNGIGRTGCFLTIHAMIERINTEHVVDFFHFIKSSRVHRADLVQELEHYRFCHDILADYIENTKSYANFGSFSSTPSGQANVATPTADSTYSNS